MGIFKTDGAKAAFAASQAKHDARHPTAEVIVTKPEPTAVIAPETETVKIFDPTIIGFGISHSYYLRKLAGSEATAETEVLFGKQVIGRLGDFQVSVEGQQTHGSVGAVATLGVFGLGAKKTSATVIVQCGTFTKAYTVKKVTPHISKSLYAAISASDARRERLAGTAVVASPVFSPADVLAQLAQLHDGGLLTDDEFAAKRLEVIGRI
jgi:hypothetical protein